MPASKDNHYESLLARVGIQEQMVKEGGRLVSELWGKLGKFDKNVREMHSRYIEMQGKYTKLLERDMDESMGGKY